MLAGFDWPTPKTVLKGFFAVSLLHAIFYFLAGLGNPLAEAFAFRQAQTALTAYWMLHGGPLINYQTPVLGAPWTVPFEFPTYQILAAALGWLGMPLNAAGRTVSFAFLIASLFPLKRLFSTLQLNDETYWVTATLFIASPIYTYWGRTFMIETTALFLAILWLYLCVEYLAKPRWTVAAACAFVGILAALTKITTFPAFLLLGGAGFLYCAFQAYKTGAIRATLPAMIVAGLLVALVPLVAAAAWNAHADAVKAMSPLTTWLMSDTPGIREFTLGTLEQRLSGTLWYGIILRRTFLEVLGWCAILSPVVIVPVLQNRRIAAMVGLALAAFLLPFMLTTNLHIVHNYYQTANGIFLIAAIGLSIGFLIARFNPWIGIALAGAFAAGQLAYFQPSYGAWFQTDYSTNPYLAAAETAKRNTRPDQALIVIGADWSSLIPYHSERKSLALTGRVIGEDLLRILADPKAALGGLQLGAIIHCGTKRFPPANSKLVAEYLSERRVIGQHDPCTVLSPNKENSDRVD